MNTHTSIGILGLGVAVPEKVLTNADFEKMVDTSDEWIVTRTGIKERHVCSDDEACSDLAAIASEQALERSGVHKDDIDMIIVCSITPDTMCPSGACHIQRKMGISDCIAFDLNAACTGFIYGLTVAKAMTLAGMVKHSLVIGVEVLSSVTDYQDRSTCVLFGDAAGAAVVGSVQNDRGIITEYISADGHFSDLIHIPAGGSRMPASEQTVKDRLHFLKMSGNELFKHAVKLMADSVKIGVERSGLQMKDVDWIIPHQANTRIMTAVAKRLRIPVEHVYMNIERYGNTSAASIPVALEEAVTHGTITSGDVVVLVAFGGGLTWGSAVIRW